MKNGKWKNVVIVILSVIVVVLMVLLAHIYVNIFPHLSMDDNSENLELENNIQYEKEELNSVEKEEINSVEKEEINSVEKEEINNFFLDEYLLNTQFMFMNFLSPSDLLLDDANSSYLYYIISRSSYANNIPSEHVSTFSISLENIKKLLKEKMNYDYSDEEIKEYFKGIYNVETDLYIVYGGGAGAFSPLLSGYKIGNEYHLVFEGGRNVILKKIDNQYYFYASMFNEK